MNTNETKNTTTTNSQLMPFQYHNKPVRVVMQEQTPWWIAKDVCDVLELTNHRKAVSSLDDDEKGVTSSDTPGGLQKMITINESGLYHLIFQSRKPDAKVFRKWITSEVIPQVMRTGAYHLPNAAPQSKSLEAAQDRIITLQAELLRLKNAEIARLTTPRQKITPVSEAERQQMVSLRAQKLSQGEIARRTGRSERTVGRVLAAAAQLTIFKNNA